MKTLPTLFWMVSGIILIYAWLLLQDSPQNRAIDLQHTESNADMLHLPDAETSFHQYAIEWTPEAIKWFADDKHYATFYNRK